MSVVILISSHSEHETALRMKKAFGYLVRGHQLRFIVQKNLDPSKHRACAFIGETIRYRIASEIGTPVSDDYCVCLTYRRGVCSNLHRENPKNSGTEIKNNKIASVVKQWILFFACAFSHIAILAQYYNTDTPSRKKKRGWSLETPPIGDYGSFWWVALWEKHLKLYIAFPWPIHGKST